jgi:hypothetical protein
MAQSYYIVFSGAEFIGANSWFFFGGTFSWKLACGFFAVNETGNFLAGRAAAA